MRLDKEIRRLRQDVIGRTHWDETFMALAETMAARADCTRRQVGAVIVDPRHRVVAIGYNGAPSGMRGCQHGGCPRGRLGGQVAPYSDYDNGPGRCVAVHAEANALLQATRPLSGCICYVTERPCAQCFRLLAAAGVVNVVWGGGQISPRTWIEENLQ